MNKQQALEALLAKCRTWEERGREVKSARDAGVRLALKKELEWLVLRGDARYASEDKHHLISIGAAALYLLADEVEVVTGRTLDEWLAAKGKDLPDMPGYKDMWSGSNPQPVNGRMGGPGYNSAGTASGTVGGC